MCLMGEPSCPALAKELVLAGVTDKWLVCGRGCMLGVTTSERGRFAPETGVDGLDA